MSTISRTPSASLPLTPPGCLGVLMTPVRYGSGVRGHFERRVRRRETGYVVAQLLFEAQRRSHSPSSTAGLGGYWVGMLAPSATQVDPAVASKLYHAAIHYLRRRRV